MTGLNPVNAMKQTVVAIIIGVILVTVFFWGNIFTPAVNYTPMVGTNDLTDLHYPFRHFMNESLQRGEFPLWASDISGGYPFHAEGQAGALYPLNIAFAFFPTLVSINLTIVVSYLLIFLFSFLFIRKIGLSVISGIFGAMLISFAGFAANEIMHLNILVSFYLFIAQLYVLELLLENSGKGRVTRELVFVLFLGLLLGLAILGGHPQITFYSLLFLVPYWLFWWVVKRKGRIIKLGLYGIIYAAIGLGIGAGQFLPQIEFTRQSTRASGLSAASINRFTFPLSEISTFVSPFATFDENHNLEAFTHNGWPYDERYVYMGIIGFVFAVVALIRFRKNGLRAIFFGLAALAAFVFSLGDQLIAGFLLRLPPFSFFRIPFKMIFIINFSFGVLAAMTLESIAAWFSSRNAKKYLVIGTMAAIFLLSFLDLRYHVKRLYPEVDARAWYDEPEVVSYLVDRLSGKERVTNQQYFYPSVKIFLEQPELWDDPQIFINLRNLLPNFNNLIYKIPKNVGATNNAGLKVARYNDLEAEVYYRGIEYENVDKLTLSDSFLFINRLMGVRYFLVTRPVQSFILSKVHQIDFETGQDSVYVYEFFDYFPRVMMVPKAQKAEPQVIKQHLLDVDFDPKRVVYIEEDIDWGAEGGYAANAQFEKYSDQEVVVSTQASGDGFLFLSDAYYPGWKAYVDGEEARILLANYAFRAVPVPEGEHTVVFKYEPESFYWGLRMTLASAAVTISAIGILVIVSSRKRNSRGLRRRRRK